MISSLVSVLLVALIAWVLWYIIGQFITGPPHQIIGMVIGLLVLLYALQLFGLVDLHQLK